MRHFIGLSEEDLKKRRQDKPVVYEPETLINSHLLICGMSGTGKSYQGLELLNSAAQAGIEIDVFDVHDELDRIAGASACVFSQATQYGYNPLVLHTDPHTGGVDRQVAFFITLIKSVTPQFGIKQESALRCLLLDTYASHGIRQDDRSTWHRQCLTEELRSSLIESKKWDELRRYYPTMEDLKAFARRKIIAMTIGGDNRCVTSFDQLTKLQRRLNSTILKVQKTCDDGEIEKLHEQVDKIKLKCKEVYTAFINQMETGREIDDILKYDSVDVLTSVLQRINLLSSTGILSANTPSFGRSRVRVHQIKSLTPEQQVLYVKLRLQGVFEQCKRQGPTPTGRELRHVVFLDEGHKFFTTDSDDIIAVIAKEARKFGLGLWCASQQPTAFPESFLTNVGATVLLGIHTAYWRRASSMFRISEESLGSIKPKEVMAVKLMREGSVDPPFTNVVVPNPNSSLGRHAAATQLSIYQQ